MTGLSEARKCWRCANQGFRRGPCQVCGRWRTAEGKVERMAGSVWGETPPPAPPKAKRRRRDW